MASISESASTRRARIQTHEPGHTWLMSGPSWHGYGLVSVFWPPELPPPGLTAGSRAGHTIRHHLCRPACSERNGVGAVWGHGYVRAHKDIDYGNYDPDVQPMWIVAWSLRR